jgi:hypothetical protein
MNLSFEGGGKVSVDIDALVRSPRVQEQVKAVRELAQDHIETEWADWVSPQPNGEPRAWARE